MHIRRVLAGGVLAIAATLFVAGTAHAQTPTTSKVKSHAEEQCIQKLEAGGTVDDCQKAPSLILPEKNELIWGGLSFTVLLVLMWKFALPGVKKAMEARTERIRADLDQADHAKSEAENVLDQYRAQLADAKSEAARIIEEARQAADAIKRDQEQRLQTELAEMRARAQADVEAAKAQAIADLRSEVAQLAIRAAELVVQKNLDPTTQAELVENYINQLATRSN
jgi:F-type H+-transporting ATPase subunit b